MNKSHVVIYTRDGCHLCEVAKALLQTAGCETEFVLEEVDIDSDSELSARYQNDIPVITINGVEAFRHRLSTSDFCDALRRSADRQA